MTSYDAWIQSGSNIGLVLVNNSFGHSGRLTQLFSRSRGGQKLADSWHDQLVDFANVESACSNWYRPPNRAPTMRHQPAVTFF